MKRFWFLTITLSLFWIGPTLAAWPVPCAPAVSPETTEERDKALKDGDVFIPRAYRVRNRNGNCVWCACETVFRGAGYVEEFNGTTEDAIRKGWCGADMADVIKVCKIAKIEVDVEEHGDTKFLTKALAEGKPCYIQIPGHALVLVGLDKDSARVIDNNGSKEVRTWERARFDQLWEGRACCPRFPRLHPFKFKPMPYDPPLPTVKPVTPSVPVPAPTDLQPILDKLAALEAKVAAIQPIAGPPGPKGDPGPPGPGGTAQPVKIQFLPKGQTPK